ncbi:MAG: TonB-dependent receptor plug domain-containing protein [Candidatus Cryptobacteroides sp.]
MKFNRILILIVLLLIPALVKAQSDIYFGDVSEIDTLNAAVVQTDKYKKAARSQTSLSTLSSPMLKRGFAVLGTPDLIKTMQLMPGVSSGTELLSGLYVRGGDGSDNLYLLDGVPMYQSSHLIGLFSSFNVDVVEDTDFYKAGFPARYGGRLSSVVDVNVRDGSLEKWKGNVSIGLIDGRFHIEGPLIKDILSLNFGIRRSWIDLLKALIPPFIPDENARKSLAGSNYAFSDINLKLTQIIKENSKLSLSLYGGMDNGKLRHQETIEEDHFDLSNSLQWGNFLATLKWDKTISPDILLMDTNIYYSQYRSSAGINGLQQNLKQTEYIDESNYDKIQDYGAKLNFYLKALRYNNIRFGASVAGHNFYPKRYQSYVILGAGDLRQEREAAESLHYTGLDYSSYIEDEVSIGKYADINLGLRYNAFVVSSTCSYQYFEPRLALRVNLVDNFYLKASYAETNQFCHQVSTSYLDLPTNIWMPSTESIKPMNAKQWVLGLNWAPSKKLNVDLEIWQKIMSHLYEYRGVNTLLPAIESWEFDYVEGSGRAKGLEINFDYHYANFDISTNYTLSKSERLFPSIYHDWYPDRNDNRHRINIQCQYRFSSDFELYAAWVYHSGNKVSGPIAVSVSMGDVIMDTVYGSPNNFKLPDYHRLDVGFNWYRKVRNGNVGVLNVSLYNAYCRLNAFYGSVKEEDGVIKGSAVGIIPIIPSISYNLSF